MAKNLPKSFLYRSCSSGSILVAAIWILAFFIILTGGLYSIISGQIRLAARVQQIFFGKHLARSACVYAVAKRNEADLPYDILYELRKKQIIELGNSELSYILIDEESKININTASSGVLKSLFEETGKLSAISAQELADAVLSRRAEQVFRLKEELLSLEGVKEESYGAYKDFITVYGKGEVNINTAAPEVLTALGMEENLVLMIKEFRLGADGKAETEDDGYFENIGEIVNKLRAFRMLSGQQESDLLSAITNNSFNVKSSNFTLQMESKILGKAGMNYRVVVDNKNKIKEWVEY